MGSLTETFDSTWVPVRWVCMEEWHWYPLLVEAVRSKDLNPDGVGLAAFGSGAGGNSVTLLGTGLFILGLEPWLAGLVAGPLTAGALD